MMAFALILSLLAVASSTAKVPVPANADLAPRELDGVVDLSTFEQLPCVPHVLSCLETSEKLVAALANTPDFPHPNFGKLQERSKEVVVSFHNFTVVAKGVGTFVSVPDVAEHNFLAQEEANNRFMKHEK
jgi:hypothetical protein